jgi:hypothetical protein
MADAIEGDIRRDSPSKAEGDKAVQEFRERSQNASSADTVCRDGFWAPGCPTSDEGQSN